MLAFPLAGFFILLFFYSFLQLTKENESIFNILLILVALVDIVLFELFWTLDFRWLFELIIIGIGTMSLVNFSDDSNE